MARDDDLHDLTRHPIFAVLEPEALRSLRFPPGNAFCAAARFCFLAMSVRMAVISCARVASCSKAAIGRARRKSSGRRR